MAHRGEVRQVSADSASGEPSSRRAPVVCASLRVEDLSEAELRSVCDLWTATFPTAATRDRYAEAVARLATAAARDEEIHAVFASDGRCLAAARTFVRTCVVGETERDVLALAHVATAAAARKRGLGALVVRAAFERLGRDGVDESVFCSGVPAFYAKLGAAVLPPLEIAYPTPHAKRFVDPAMLRVATPKARPWPAGDRVFFAPNGDGW